MSDQTLIATINQAWEDRDTLNTDTTGEIRDAVNEALNMMDIHSLLSQFGTMKRKNTLLLMVFIDILPVRVIKTYQIEIMADYLLS